jgi:hypothetical protein
MYSSILRVLSICNNGKLPYNPDYRQALTWKIRYTAVVADGGGV